jgi:hypothetical protein
MNNWKKKGEIMKKTFLNLSILGVVLFVSIALTMAVTSLFNAIV